MTGQLNQFGAARALDAVNGRATATSRTMYLALCTVAVTDTDTLSTITEVTTSGYSRQTCAWGTPSGDPSVAANTGLITFGPFSADPPSIGYLCLTSASSGTSGDITYFWTADVARDGINGDSITVAIGALTMQLD